MEGRIDVEGWEKSATGTIAHGANHNQSMVYRTGITGWNYNMISA